MKRVWKYILYILLIIILATAGTIYYFLNMKTYDTADKEIEEIIKSDYDIILPGEEVSETNTNNKNTSTVNNNNKTTTVSDSDQETNNINEDSSTKRIDSTETAMDSSDEKESGNSATNSSKKNESNSNKSANNSDSNSESTDEVTVADIKDRYRPVFESLQSQANQKIDSLTTRAIEEYQTQKADGESISYSYFYQKYSSAGRDLEEKTNETFDYIYSALEKELKENGFSTAHAQDFKDQYTVAKKERESALLNKAKEAL